MPEHKMRTIDGVRYRPEDIAPGRRPAESGPLTASLDQRPVPAESFDPAAHDVETVRAHLGQADEAERKRVLAAERAGKNRKGITGAGA